jgi:hypothetical protein
MYGYGYSLYNRLAFLGGLDPNASAFLTATGITDPTIQGAVNSLVVDLKKYGLWSKMKAIYPFVGGTATTHKFNLKNPLDTDGAFRLTFNGGWTHSSNGATPNGTNGYANTFLTPSINLSVGSSSFGIYSRTQDVVGNKLYGASNTSNTYLQHNLATGDFISGAVTNIVTYTANPTTGFLLATRTSTTLLKAFRNNVSLGTNTTTASTITNARFYLGARNNDNTSQGFYNAYQHAFSFIGDGLTDEDSANLYYSVQKFQTTLGRQVGTPIYSSNATDVNARLFLGATNIQDATITSAVDTLVQGLKTDGIWSKLKAVYPFVGGTATTHKFNLANALDEDSAFRLAFNGGWTHSSNGATPNGTNGYANTFLTPSTSLSVGSNSFGMYSRTQDIVGNKIYGVLTDSTTYLQNNLSAGNLISGSILSLINYTPTPTTGLILATRTSTTLYKGFRNNVSLGSSTVTISSLPNLSFYLGTRRDGLSAPVFYNAYQHAFAFIGDGLSDTEASNLYTRVQAFQTTLNRQL